MKATLFKQELSSYITFIIPVVKESIAAAMYLLTFNSTHNALWKKVEGYFVIVSQCTVYQGDMCLLTCFHFELWPKPAYLSNWVNN